MLKRAMQPRLLALFFCSVAGSIIALGTCSMRCLQWLYEMAV